MTPGLRVVRRNGRATMGRSRRLRAMVLEMLEPRALLTALTFSEFPISPGVSGGLNALNSGPDGNLWYTTDGSSGNMVGNINPTTHAVNQFGPLSDPVDLFGGIRAGPDSNSVWFTEPGNPFNGGDTIGTFNLTTQKVTEFTVPTANSSPTGIVAGPDGNLWFTENGARSPGFAFPVYTPGDQIGMFNPSTQTFQEFADPSASGPLAIVVGPDKNLWFTEAATAAIGTFNLTTDTFQDFPLPNANSLPGAIVAGPDGNLWFTEENASKIGKINPTTGAITEFATPTASSSPVGITVGPDGNIWFTESGVGQVGMVDLSNNDQITEFTLPGTTPTELTLGPDKKLWFVNANGDSIGVIQTPPHSLTFTVTSTLDDGSTGTLRWAINQVNADTNDSSTSPDKIQFDIPQSDGGFNAATGVWTITPTSALPALTRPVILDGDTQPGAQANTNGPGLGDNAALKVVINGANVGGTSGGLTLTGGNSTVRGLVINGFNNGPAIDLQTAGNDLIEGNFLGTDSSGTTAQFNHVDLMIEQGSSDNTIGGATPDARNVISAGNIAGLEITNSSGNLIAGNFLGLDAAGTAPPSTSSTVTFGDLVLLAAGATGNTVGGTTAAARNIITGTDFAGVHLSGTAGATASNNLIEGNYFGTDVTGTVGLGNGSLAAESEWGIEFGNFVTNNTIGGLTATTGTGPGNLLSGMSIGVTTDANINLSGATPAVSGNLIEGNLIGTDPTGTKALANSTGISIDAGTGNTIGGTSSQARNVISGNTLFGVSLSANNNIVNNLPITMKNVVDGNYIGTDISGTASVPNQEGVDLSLSAFANTIGGTSAGAGNVISGNSGLTGHGIGLDQAVGNVIEGNFIGTNAAGTAALGNGGNGVYVDFSSNNTIGGTTAAARNVISGNTTNGMDFDGQSSGNVVEGNFVGTDVTGQAALPNRGSGAANPGAVVIENGSSQNTVGGSVAGAGNVIAENAVAGVVVAGDTSTGNAILGNTIFGNGKLGIDLGGTGTPLANTAGGPHSGPNNLQNYPVLNTPSVSSGKTTLAGTLNSTPNTTFRIEFFSNPAADPSGHGQGQTFLGFVSATTDANGNTPTFSLQVNADLTGQFIAATATDPAGNTSEFSATALVNTSVAPGVPGAPMLGAGSNTGVNKALLLTRDNGSAAAPLAFTVSGVSPPDAFIQLYDDSNPASPKPLGSPVQASGGTATVTLSGGTNLPLADGVYKLAASASLTAGGTQSALSTASAAITIQTSLRVLTINASSNFYNGSSVPLPNNGQIIATFNHPLAGLSAEDPNATGFKGNPFAVMLIPAGPDGLATQQRTGVFWSGPSGVDSGDLPLPATATYQENANGTATITLTPNQPLSTDIYLITVNNLFDLAGNPVADANGQVGNVYSSFDYRPVNTLSPSVASITAEQGTVAIANNSTIAQPDSIAIAFNRPMDTYTINTNTVQLLAKGPGGTFQAVQAAVTYSPATDTAYVTPEQLLPSGTVCQVRVTTGVTDDEAFPTPGVHLRQEVDRTFTVTGGPPSSAASLTVTATTPVADTAWTQQLGYGTVTFSQPLTLDSAHLGRFSAMLVPHTGGVTTGSSGYADVPYNAKVAFNPNTNQLVMVFTGVPTSSSAGVLQVFALTAITSATGSTLQPDPGGGLPVYRNFEIKTPNAQAADVRRSGLAPALPATIAATEMPGGTMVFALSSGRKSAVSRPRPSRLITYHAVPGVPAGPLANRRPRGGSATNGPARRHDFPRTEG